MTASFSADGTKIAAVTRPGRGSDGGAMGGIDVVDTATDAKTQVLSDRLRSPITVWSPDGMYVAYLAQRNGNHGVYRKRSDGTGREQLLYRFPPGVLDVYLNDWSADGRFLAFTTGTGVLSVLPVMGERSVTELIREEFRAFGARFSPDGRFLAYVSDESGRNEVYVRQFDGVTGEFASATAQQLSTGGGEGLLHWRRDGRGLYFLAPGGAVMAVDIATPSLVAQPPMLLFGAPGGSGQLQVNYGDAGYSGSVSPASQFLFRVLAPPQRRATAVAPALLATYAGTYVNAGSPLAPESVVAVEGNELVIRRAGQTIPLTAESETSFFRRTATRDDDFEFVSDGQGMIAHFFEYNQNGRVMWIPK